MIGQAIEMFPHMQELLYLLVAKAGGELRISDDDRAVLRDGRARRLREGIDPDTGEYFLTAEAGLIMTTAPAGGQGPFGNGAASDGAGAADHGLGDGVAGG